MKYNPIKELTKREWALWLGSLMAVAGAYLASGTADPLTLAAACVGITALVFAAKGNVWAQILMIIFSVMYGVLSWRMCYWGEMLTYLGMTLPMAVWSAAVWLLHPAENGTAVAIQKLTARYWAGLSASAAAVTAVFYLILQRLDTPNLLWSTVSVTTSFFAAALTMLRSSYYALGYAANDLVLIVLWLYASLKSPVYLPIAVNFAVFFLNDLYGFANWKKREKLCV